MVETFIRTVTEMAPEMDGKEMAELVFTEEAPEMETLEMVELNIPAQTEVELEMVNKEMAELHTPILETVELRIPIGEVLGMAHLEMGELAHTTLTEADPDLLDQTAS